MLIVLALPFCIDTVNGMTIDPPSTTKNEACEEFSSENTAALFAKNAASYSGYSEQQLEQFVGMDEDSKDTVECVLKEQR